VDIRNSSKSTKLNSTVLNTGLRLVARHPPQSSELFEEMINAARLHAPNSALCFNTKATDTVQAVDRVLAKAKG
jgi:hypothetical protein